MSNASAVYPSGGAGVLTAGFPGADYPSGYFIQPSLFITTPAAVALTQDVLFLVPVIVKRRVVIDSIMFQNGVSLSGRAVRLGLYSTTNRVPVTLLSESSSTAIADSNTWTVRDVALGAAQTLDPGIFYAGLVGDGTVAGAICGASLTSHYGSSDFPVLSYFTAGGSPQVPGPFTKSHTYGALPATLSGLTNIANSLVPTLGLGVQ